MFAERQVVLLKGPLDAGVKNWKPMSENPPSDYCFVVSYRTRKWTAYQAGQSPEGKKGCCSAPKLYDNQLPGMDRELISRLSVFRSLALLV